MSYETFVVQPAVESRLQSIKWEYEKEPVISRAYKRIRPDFLATDKGWVYLIECKGKLREPEKIRLQILRYQFLLTGQRDNRIEDLYYQLWVREFEERRLSHLAMVARQTKRVVSCLILPKFVMTNRAQRTCNEYFRDYGIVVTTIDVPRSKQMPLIIDTDVA